MQYIQKDRQIHIVWSIFRGTSDVPEDFSRALVKVFLIGNYEKYYLPATAEGGNLIIDIPPGLPESAYSLEAIWVKNYGNLMPHRDTLTPSEDSACQRRPGPHPNDPCFIHPHDHHGNDRCLMRSRKDYVFALTTYDSETTYYKDAGEVTLKMRSSVATYGYDGLSSYQIAVMRGDFCGSEKEFLEQSGFTKLKTINGESIIGEGNIEIEGGGGGLTEIPEATETELGGIKASPKTYNETVEAKIGKDGKLYVPKAVTSVTNYNNNPDDEDLHSVDKGSEKVLQFADKDYNAASFSGLGRVYLRKNISLDKNVLTQEMINKDYTRYIVQYDYDLEGKTISVPVGCIFDFQGGSLTNGTLSGTNTKILGYPRINCDFGGEFAGVADFSWFGLKPDDKEFDNALIINKYGAFFSNIYIPTGKYYTKTPIVIDGRKNITIDGNISYLGDINSTCITIKNAYSNGINVNGSISNSENINLSHANFGKDMNIIGIDFQNCNNCKVYVSTVVDFSENMRISGIGDGCSYNLFRFDLLNDGNVGLRIYQEDVEDAYGWANENMFIGGRIAISQSWNTESIDANAIRIEGAEAGKDSYNKVNALYFLKISSEWFKHTGYTIYAKNLLSSTFAEGRNENSATYIKWVGQCNRNDVDLGYLRNPTFDYTEATGYPLRWDGDSISKHKVATIDTADMVPCYPSGTYRATVKDFRFNFVRYLSSVTDLNISTTISDSYDDGFLFTLPAVRIDTTIAKTFAVYVDNPVRIHVAYIYDNSNKKLAQEDQQDYLAPLTFYGKYGISLRGFNNGIEESSTIFMIPDNIIQIEVSIRGKFNKAVIYSKEEMSNLILEKAPQEGTLSDVPNYGYSGQEYLNTDNYTVLRFTPNGWTNRDGTLINKIGII